MKKIYMTRNKVKFEVDRAKDTAEARLKIRQRIEEFKRKNGGKHPGKFNQHYTIEG